MPIIALNKPIEIAPWELATYLPCLSYRTIKDMDNDTVEILQDFRNSNKVIFGFTKLNEELAFKEFYTECTPDELAYWLAITPQFLRTPIKRSLERTSFEIPVVDEVQTEMFQQQYRAKQKLADAVMVANLTGQPKSIGKFIAADARHIVQHAIAYTDAFSEKPIICSNGAYSCVNIAIYNPESRVGAIAHFDGYPVGGSLEEMIKQIQGTTNAALDVHLRGATNLISTDMIEKMIDLIYKNPLLKIKSCNVLSTPPKHGGMGLAIDVRNGDTYTDWEDDQTEYSPAEQSKAVKEYRESTNYESPLFCQFDGRGTGSIEKAICNTYEPCKKSERSFTSEAVDITEITFGLLSRLKAWLAKVLKAARERFCGRE